MYRWLLPKPLWTKDRSAFDTSFWPLTEDQEGKYLVVRESSVQPGPVLKQTTLAVLDQRTGKTLYETPAEFGEIDEECDAPRIVGDNIWRIKRGGYSELRRWRFKTDLSEEVIHTWPGIPDSGHYFDWSQDKRRLLLQKNALRYEPYVIAMQPDLFMRACMAALDAKLLPRLTSWESWELPLDDNAKLKFHGRWSPHFSRWGEYGNLSADGKYIAFGDIFNGSYRSRIGHQKTLQGEALLDVFRVQPAGCLIYDTSTGKLQHHLKVPNYFFLRPKWFGNTLLTVGHAADGRVVQPDEIVKHPTTTGFVFYWLTKERNVAYRIDQQSITPISLPDELTDSHLYATVVNHALALEKLEKDSSDVYLLKTHADSLQVELELRQIPQLDSFGRSWMLPGCNQIISDTSPPPDPLDSMRAWIGKIPWLADWVSIRQMGVNFAFLHSPTTTRPHGIALGQVCCNYNKPDLHHLYLMSLSFDEDGYESAKTLSCYAMPMQFYSTWLSIGAGLVVMVLGLVVLTRRAVRRSWVVQT